jgi:hypothetical protein
LLLRLALKYSIVVVMKGLVDAIGLGTPFYLASATYGFFHWLDRNASLQANRAISAWLSGRPYSVIDVRGPIVAAFDRLYTSPLFRWRALGRSAAISTLAVFIYVCFQYYIHPYWRFMLSVYVMAMALSGEIFLNHLNLISYFQFIVVSWITLSVIISDYASLFIVRRSLLIAKNHPIPSILLSIACGMFVVSMVLLGLYLFICFIGAIVHLKIIYPNPFAPSEFFWPLVRKMSLDYFELVMFSKDFQQPWIIFLPPGFFVYSWLFLLGFGAIGVRVLYSIFRAVAWAQWFLRQGDRHPLQAIGMVAGVIVFVGTAAWRLFAS